MFLMFGLDRIDGIRGLDGMSSRYFDASPRMYVAAGWLRGWCVELL